jgi:nicotinate-nucleotide pyrophosphorylase (carboxylating)
MILDMRWVGDVVERALAEDVGQGDLTTRLVVDPSIRARGVLVARQEGVLAGLDVAKMVFQTVDPATEFVPRLSDGSMLNDGAVCAEISGSARSCLAAERVALNFLQRMSGVATLTARFVHLVAGTRAQILDTRKTTPGLRMLEKYAVHMGGGRNHRMGLYDAILIKDNHIAIAGGIREAVRRAQHGNADGLPIEVEVSDLAGVDEAIEAGADRIMLDNMDLSAMRSAVERVAGRAELEASGGVSPKTVRAIAETGVDYISIGALTHSAPAIDISMELSIEGSS